MNYVRKPLQELDLIDNFLFGSLMTHPVYGPYVGRSILEKILQRKLGELIVIPQKIYYGSDTHLHGIQLDVHLEEKLDATTVYDVEPELDSKPEAIKALPKRVRFYHAKMTSRGLKAGEKYGALTLFLYTKGTIGIPSEEVQQLLRYMEDSSLENVTNVFLQELHGMVEHVKRDEEVPIRYMRMMEDERDLLERGRQIGIEEGIEKGIEKGLHQGVQAFVLDNLEENVPRQRIVEKLIKHFSLSSEEAEVYYNKYSV